MLLAFLLVLSAAKVNSESVVEDALRKSRQLDLGLQDIRNPYEEKQTTVQLPSSQKNEVINGYLPPVSPPEIVGSQTQQAFNFKLANSVEKESDLCKPPFDNESCGFKVSSASDSKIPKPSRDLVPPYNDLEQELANKATTLFEKTNEGIKTTIQSQTRIFKTTTEQPTTKIFKAAPTQNIARFIKTTAKPNPVASTAEATNELRSYLPPQQDISPAAQTNVAVVQPPSQNNDHHHHDHHHGHHHDENFNICDDAFHAFLCAPLKARKRITGALPSSLLGQSSFINYQKTLYNPDRETASSNAFRNEYLPPKPSPTNLIQSTASSNAFRNEYLPPQPSPTNLIQSTYVPPVTTRRPFVTTTAPTTTTTTTARPFSPPKFIPEPSNSNDRYYLPPLPDNSLPIKPAPSNQAISTVKPSPPPTPATFSVSTFFPTAPAIPIFNSVASDANNLYLPPQPNPQPAASFVSTSENFFPIISTVSPLSSTYIPVSTVTHFSPLPSNSIFITQKPKPTISTVVTTSSATELQFFPTTTKPIVRVPAFSQQPSNPSGSYLPPINEFQSASKPVPTTVKPFTNSFKFSEQSSNTDRSYLPPDPEEPAAAQISSAAVAAPQVKNPFHHGRDLCTDPFHSFLCVSAKPRKRITGQLPSGFRPDSSNTNEVRLKPESSNQDESRVPANKPLEAASAQDVGYRYPKPVNPLPTPSNAVTSTASPSTGYSYPKPEKIFPLPSQQNVKVAPPSTTRKPDPVLKPSEARVFTGYEYPKPDKVFPLPTEQENTKVITTTNPPVTGYSYPKPLKPFPLPTEQKEVRQKPAEPSSTALPTNTVKGYQYPKPEQSLNLPEKKGYSYPKPEKRLELPTESLNSRFKLPQSKSNLEALGNLSSAEFIPVNKLDIKRSESSKLIAGLRRFGERMKKLRREAAQEGAALI